MLELIPWCVSMRLNPGAAFWNLIPEFCNFISGAQTRGKNKRNEMKKIKQGRILKKLRTSQ